MFGKITIKLKKVFNKLWLFIKDNKSIILWIIIALIALKIFVPQIDNLIESLKALRDADLAWVLLGTIVFFLGLPVLTWQYLELALKPLKFWLTFRVQMAGLFVSKLLPSSLGTFSLNLYYLIQQKHTVIQGSTVMAMNAFTSGVAYAILIIIALIAGNFTFGTIDLKTSTLPIGVIVLIVIGIIVACYIIYKIPKFNIKIKKSVKDIANNLKEYKDNPRAVIMGIILNGIGSLTSLFALYASAHAIGVDLSMPEALLAYTFGNIAAGLVPIPGGLGAAEAGIYAGLTIVGVDSTDAITITLLYRLISYWLPIIPGYYYFWSLRKTVLANFSIKNNKQPK